MGMKRVGICPRCKKGELFIDRDLYGWYECCLQCGYTRDFPELVREIRAKGPKVLGMSYEIAEAKIDDVGAEIWAVSDFTFTGAAVLRRDKAAYKQTWIELQ